MASGRAWLRPVPITSAPAQRASWTAVDPTAPPAPWMTTVWPLASLPWSNRACHAVRPARGTAAAWTWPAVRGFERHVAGLDGHVPGGRAVTELIGQPEHLVADGEAGRTVAERGDHAGDLVVPG